MNDASLALYQSMQWLTCTALLRCASLLTPARFQVTNSSLSPMLVSLLLLLLLLLHAFPSYMLLLLLHAILSYMLLLHALLSYMLLLLSA